MASRLPPGKSVEFRRWKQRAESNRLHSRYVLTDLGGVPTGVGIEAAAADETDHLLFLLQEQYLRHRGQYTEENGSFDSVDKPATIGGARAGGGACGQ